MAHRAAFEVVNKTISDIRANSLPIVGIPVVFCGDFRQILSVIRSGARANIIDASIKKSNQWSEVTVLSLTTNMRTKLTKDDNANMYSKVLIDIGDGKYPVTIQPDCIQLPETIRVVDSTESLIDAIYGNVHNEWNSKWLLERSILASHNETVNTMNDHIIHKFSRQSATYLTVDSALTEEEAAHSPVEFLSSMEISGMPPHRLEINLNSPVMMLRSLDPPYITYGTRCIVERLFPNVMEMELLHGPSAGKHYFIPRIPLIPSEDDLPFTFSRLQFPLRPCFVMTINQSQGKTFEEIGVDLTIPVFSHGMLYVWLSKIGCAGSVKVVAPNDTTRNVVYREIFAH